MLRAKSFIFDSYSFEPTTGTISLRYSLDDEVTFTETLVIPVKAIAQRYDREALDRALQALHLIGGISYYKTCCPQTIDVRGKALSPAQADFYATVYEKGLGEFYYRNRDKITYVPGMINFPATASNDAKLPASNEPTRNEQRTLILIGGGKDSIVTIEKTVGDVTLLRVGGNPIIDHLAKIAGKPLISVERRLSPELFTLNEQGALNGHIPITAFISAVSVVVAVLGGFTRVLISNEESASEGNLMLDALEVNHQWSKSRAFVRSFQQYLAEWVTKDVTYENALQGMSELTIVSAFTHYPQYFSAFTSCNKNWKIHKPATSNQRWCQSCPKCAFVFAMLAAYLPAKAVTEIFGRNLFADASLWPLYEELLGLQRFKPFECVGTPEETKEALRLAQKRGDFAETIIMQKFSSLR